MLFIRISIIYLQQRENMKGSSLTQTHLLKVNMSFHAISLIVKFNCSIILVLRTRENKIICETQPRPLVQGLCQINQQLQLEWQSIYDVGRSEYMQTSMQISVMVSSSNGKIHAGTCTINIAHSQSKSIIPIKKCSDKSATLCLSSNFQFLSVIQERDQHDNESGNYLNSSLHHGLKRMRSVEFPIKNEDSQLSISKIAVSNKRMETFLRGENQELQRHNEILDGKLKISERREKQLIQQLKQTNSILQKLHNRSSPLENSSEVNQTVVYQKDRAIKSLQSQVKMKDIKIKELKQQLLTLQRKYQMKQQNYQDQIRKLNERINLLQIQLQESTQNQNNLLNKIENVEKNNQSMIKERQKNLVLEKIKLTKELSQREKVIKSLQKQRNDLKEKLLQIEDLNKKEREDKDFQKTLLRKDQQIDTITQQNKKLMLKQRQLQEQILELNKTNLERTPFRRKINQLQSQNNSLKMQIEKTNQLLSFNELKLKDLTNKQEQLQKERKRTQKKIQEALSNCSTLSSNCNELQKEIGYYKENYQKLAEMFKDTKEKKQDAQKRFKKQLQQWSRQIEILATERAKLSNDNNDLKWEIYRHEQTVRQSQATINQYKAESFDLKQQLILKAEKYEQFQIKQQELQQVIAKLQESLETSQSKIKELLKSNSENVSIITLNGKQKEHLLENIEELKKDYQNIIHEMHLQKHNYENSLQMLQEQIKQKKEQIQRQRQKTLSKQLEIKGLKDKLAQAHRNLDGILAENQLLSHQNIMYSSQMSHKQIEIKSLKEITAQQEKEINQQKEKFNKISKEFTELTLEYSKYKENNSDAVRWVLYLLGEEEFIVEEQTVFFPQEKLRTLEVEAVKNRNLLLTKMKNSIKSIKQQKEFLAFELQKIGQQLVDSSNDYEELLERERTDRETNNKELIAQINALISQLEDTKADYKDLKASNDSYFKQNRMFEHKLEELQQDKSKLVEDKVELHQKLKEGQYQIKQLTEKIISLEQQSLEKQQAIASAQRNTLTLEQRKRYEQQIANFEAKIKLRQEQIIGKDNKLKHLQEKCILIENEKRKAEFSLTVLRQVSGETQNKMQEATKAKGQLQGAIAALQEEIQKKEKVIQQKDLQLLQEKSHKNGALQKLTDALESTKQIQSCLQKQEKEISIKNEEVKQAKSRLKEVEDSSNKINDSLEKQLNKILGQIAIQKLLLEKSQSMVQEMKNEIAHLRHQLQAKKQFVNKLESDHQMAQKEVYFEQSHKNTLIRQFEDLSQNYEHAKQEIYLLEEQQLKLQKEIQSLIEENRSYAKKMEESIEMSRMRVVRQVADLKKKLESEQLKMTKLQAKYEETKHLLKETESIVEKKEFLLLASQQQKQKLKCDFQQQMQRLNAQIQKLHERQQEIRSDYKEEREQLMRQIENLNLQCDQLGQLIRKKEEQLNESQREHDSSLRKIEYLESEMKQPSPKSPKISTPESLKDLDNKGREKPNGGSLSSIPSKEKL